MLLHYNMRTRGAAGTGPQERFDMIECSAA
jgi:hypothetical protein